tara:strand:- start:779 stop:916 length:138 start_codon:yes stop_codon:yes gene_type:complete
MIEAEIAQVVPLAQVSKRVASEYIQEKFSIVVSPNQNSSAAFDVV